MILILISELTMPPVLQKSSGQIPRNYVEPYGSNTSFELSGPFANSSYLAWVLGPDRYEPTMDSFSVEVNVLKTGQNTSSFESTLSVEKAVYVSEATSNITKYSTSPFFGDNQSGLSISFNGLWRDNTTISAVVYVTFVEESVLGPIHLPGQSLTVALPLEFNMTR